MSGDAAAKWPKPIMLLELLTEPAHDQERADLIEGLLPRGGTSLLVGKPKTGKSTIARSIMHSIATGQPFLSRTVRRGGVVLLALEDRREQLRQAMSRMDFRSEEQIVIFPAGTAPTKDRAQQWVSHLVQTYAPALVIIDTLNRLLRIPDLNDYGNVDNLVAPITELAAGTGVHVVFVHHATKASRGADVDAVLGSSALSGAVDSVLLLNRRGDVRTLRCSSHRWGTDLPETVLALDHVTGLVKSGAHSSLDDVEEKILKLLSKEGSMKEEKIRALVGGDHGRIAKALRSALASGHLTRSGIGRTKHPYIYSPGLGATPPPRNNEQNEQPEGTSGEGGSDGVASDND